MSDDIYVIYYNGKLLGVLTDSESFWQLYEWLSDSNGVCNVITVSKSMFEIPDNFENFNKFVAEHGEVTVGRSKICLQVHYDDNLI